LGGLKERMLEPELVAAFIEAFNAELRHYARTADEDRSAAKRALADVERKLSGILRAIEDGAYNATLKSRLTTLVSADDTREREGGARKETLDLEGRARGSASSEPAGPLPDQGWEACGSIK
jgi:hypothetical protein